MSSQTKKLKVKQLSNTLEKRNISKLTFIQVDNFLKSIMMPEQSSVYSSGYFSLGKIFRPPPVFNNKHWFSCTFPIQSRRLIFLTKRASPVDDISSPTFRLLSLRLCKENFRAVFSYHFDLWAPFWAFSSQLLQVVHVMWRAFSAFNYVDK